MTVAGTSVGLGPVGSLALPSEASNSTNENASARVPRGPLRIFINHFAMIDAKLSSFRFFRQLYHRPGAPSLLRRYSDATGVGERRTDSA